MQVSTIYNLFCAVHTLHNQRRVHCDLQPIHFGWFNEQQQWKVVGLATWAHVGAARNPTMCYAAPEVQSLHSLVQALTIALLQSMECMQSTVAVAVGAALSRHALQMS